MVLRGTNGDRSQTALNGTPHRPLALKIEGMWEELARSHRAWDLLSAVLTGRLDVGRLHDQWEASRKDPVETRRRLSDVNVSALVEDWHAVHAQRVKPDSAEHALVHVRHFFPAESEVRASAVTAEWLTERLYAYGGKRNTLRKVHSSLSVFLDYCASVRNVFPTSPATRVKRPPVERSPIRFYEIETVEQIIEAQPTVDRRAFFALLYGTGTEVSVALRLLRSDVNPATKEIRAPGTKAHSRDRISRVAEWAWPIFWEHARTVLPAGPIFPSTWDRFLVSDWHRQNLGEGAKDTHGSIIARGLNLPKPQRYPLHCARDHWAVRAARAGTPTAVIQAQLGHGSPMLTLTKYGRFQPSAADRQRWENAATAYDAERRAAK